MLYRSRLSPPLDYELHEGTRSPSTSLCFWESRHLTDTYSAGEDSVTASVCQAHDLPRSVLLRSHKNPARSEFPLALVDRLENRL